MDRSERFRRIVCASAFLVAACSDAGAAKPSTHDAGAGEDRTPERAGPARWTMYGHDLSNTQADEGTGLVSQENIPRLAEKWRALVGGGATSTPMVADARVYFGAWDGFFYAVDSATGEPRWKKALGKQFVRSSALVTQDRVYAAADGSLVALSRFDGSEIFRTVLIEHPQGFIESSPKLADGVIVLGLASYELNLKKSDYDFEGSVIGIDSETGGVLWTVPVTGTAEGVCKGGSGVSVWSSAAIDRELGLAYIGTGQTYEAPASTCNDSLLALHYKADHQGERIAWKATYTADDVYVAAGGGVNGLDHDIGAAPNLFLAGGVKAVGAGDKGGTYRVFNRQTGDQLWRADLNHSNLAQLGGVMSTAAVANGAVFVASNSWMAFGFLSGMHAATDTSTLYALDAATGATRWSQSLDAPVFGSYAVSNGILFHSTIRGVLYARDAATGGELWKADTGAPIGSGITISDEGVYVSGGFSLGAGSSSGQVVGYAISPGASRTLDMREPVFASMSVAECNESLATLQPDALCRSCLCDCNASTTGACHAGCWEQAACVVENCASMSGGGLTACYTEHCSSKLLPPNVFQESLRSAACVLTCTSS